MPRSPDIIAAVATTLMRVKLLVPSVDADLAEAANMLLVISTMFTLQNIYGGLLSPDGRALTQPGDAEQSYVHEPYESWSSDDSMIDGPIPTQKHAANEDHNSCEGKPNVLDARGAAPEITYPDSCDGKPHVLDARGAVLKIEYPDSCSCKPHVLGSRGAAPQTTLSPPIYQAVSAPTTGGAAPQTTYLPSICQADSAPITGGAAPQTTYPPPICKAESAPTSGGAAPQITYPPPICQADSAPTSGGAAPKTTYFPPICQAESAPTTGGAAPQTTYFPPICQAESAPTTEGAASKSLDPGSFTSSGKRTSNSLGKRTSSQSQKSDGVSERERSLGVASSQADKARTLVISPLANLTPERIAQEYEYPIKEAASHLGLSVNSMRDMCRKYDIKRWPQRKLQSITVLITSLEDNHVNCQSQCKCQEEISQLSALKNRIKRDPNFDIPRGTTKLRQYTYKKKHLDKLKNQTTSCP
eukprot:gene2903-4961_t